MYWHKKLYFNDGIKDKKKIVKNVKKGKLQFSAFVITLPSGNDGILEIYPSYVLLQPAYKSMELYVIGIADDREAALELVSKIVMECYKATGNFNISDYIRKVEGQ